MAIERPLPRRSPVGALERVRLRERAVGVPLLVAGLSLAAILARVWLGRRIPTPLFLIDELVYSELAKSFAAGAHFLIRDQPGPYYGPAYPIAISPAWLVHSTETSYAVAKAINALVMTLAVVPIFLWARRLVAPALSAVAVALVLLMPVFVYTGTLMTENLAFPAFLAACFAIALALERPSVRRQLLAFVAIGIACSVRVQAFVLVLILPTALLLAALLALRARGSAIRPRPLLGELARFRLSLGALSIGAAAYVALKVAEGASLSSGLGAYSIVGNADYSLRAAARWIVYHYAELFFSVGVVPASAFIVLFGLAWVRRHTLDAAERAFLSVTAAVLLCLVIEVGLFASRFADRIEERNMVYAAPLLLLALLVWLDRGLPRPSGLTTAAALAPAALLITLPLESLLNQGIVGDTFGLIPLLRLSSKLSGTDDVRIALAAGALAAGLAFVAFPRRLSLYLFPAGIAVFLVLSSYVVFGSVRDYSRGLNAVSSAGDRNWIDDAIGTEPRAAFVFGGSSDLASEATFLWENEFWNRSVGTVYNLGFHERAGLPETDATLDPSTGRIAPSGGAPIRERFAVVSREMHLAGTLVRQQGPLALYRVAPPVRLADKVEGVFADGWTGADAAVMQYALSPNRAGTLRITLGRMSWSGPDVSAKVTLRLGTLILDPNGSPQIGFTTSRRTWVVHPGGERVFALPTPAPPFRAEIHVDPTFSPAQFGSADTRQLGVQLSFRFVAG